MSRRMDREGVARGEWCPDASLFCHYARGQEIHSADVLWVTRYDEGLVRSTHRAIVEHLATLREGRLP